MSEKLSKQQLIIQEQQKLFKNRKVVQLNKLIKGDVSAFSVNDLKIFKLIISKVNSKDTLFKDFYEINTDEIKALNINEKHLYNETKKSLKRLANIYITFDEGNSIREVGLIRNDFKFEKYSKKILINFNDNMGEFIINLKNNFFMYDLIDIVNFKFKHTLKFYEHIKSHSLNVIKLKIDTVKEILDLNNKYKRYTNFKNDVLEIIVEEINECSNTLFISYTEEKKGAKVEYIIFHIKRISNNLLLDAKPSNIYSQLIGLECIYLDKYHILENIDVNTFLISLKEKHTQNMTNIVKDNKEGLEKVLKELFPDKYNQLVSENGEQDEIKRLLAAKDFKAFKEEVINQYRGKKLANNMPNFQPETIISVDEQTGYLINSTTNKAMTKEQSLIIWKLLYKNKDLVGKIADIDDVKQFINITVVIKKKGVLGVEEIKYIIEDIKEEIEKDEVKYRLYLKDVFDPLKDIEVSKSLLTLEQLKLFISNSRVK